MLAYLRFELARLLRNRSVLVFTVLLPLVIYVAFTAPADKSSVAMVMTAGWGAVMGALSIGAGVSEERANGWLHQLRTTPLSPSRVVAGKAMVSTLPAIPAVVAIGAAAVLQHGVLLPAGRWPLVAASMWLGTAPFALLGLVIGYLASRQVAGPVVTISWLVLSVAGGLITSVDDFPEWFQPVSRAMPSYRYAELGWRAAGGSSPSAAGAALLAGWTVLFGCLAAWAYRRSAAAR